MNLSLSGDWLLREAEPGQGLGRGYAGEDLDDSGWHQVTVPGNIHLQIGLENPYQDTAEVARVNQQEWWFRKRFRLPADAELPSPTRIRLHFGGVDYFCDVWLNGVPVGSHAGMYTPFCLDVTETARVGEENVLALRVTCPYRPAPRYWPHESIQNLNISDDEYMKGNQGTPWDAIPATGSALLPIGVWKDVWLEMTGPLTIDDLTVASREPADGAAMLTVSWSLVNHAGPRTVDLRLVAEPDNFEGEPEVLHQEIVSLSEGTWEGQRSVTLHNPQLWWTWDSGPQNLYRLRLQIREPADGETPLVEHAVTFGVRFITRDRDRMAYSINGQQLFLRGSWYLSGYFLGHITRAMYQRDLLFMRHAHMNHVVNFGAVEHDSFYEYCDRLGILVFTELPFPQQGPTGVLRSGYPRKDEWTRWALGEVGNIVRQLRSHPSLAVWGVFAEVKDMDLYDQYDYADFLAAAEGIVASLDPDTIYQASFCDFNEQHFWYTAFRRGEDYRWHFEAEAAFISEYGCQALPSEPSLRSMMSEEQLWRSDGTVDERIGLPIDGQAYGFNTGFGYEGFTVVWDNIRRFVDRHPDSLDRLIEASQLYQAFIHRYAGERYRQKQLQPVAGIRSWAFKEVCPRIGFMLIDHMGQPRLSYEWAREAGRLLKPSFELRDALEPHAAGSSLSVPVHLLYDGRQPGRARTAVWLADLEGRQMAHAEFVAELQPARNRSLGEFQLTLPAEPGIYLLCAETETDRGEVATNRIPLKVVTPAFRQVVRLLLVGQRRYSEPVLAALSGTGVEVEVLDETCAREAHLDPDALRARFDALWLTGWDGLWKEWEASDLGAIREAVAGGLGFIHSGGQGCFDGEGGRQAHLAYTPLDDVLPVDTCHYDVLYEHFPTARLSDDGAPHPLADIDLAGKTVAPYHRVLARSGSDVVYRLGDVPLLISGSFGRGRSVAFGGFLTAPLLEMSSGTRWFAPADAYLFRLVLGLIAEATGLPLSRSLAELEEERRKPLYESLGELPPAAIQIPETLQLQVSESADVAYGSFSIVCEAGYAHLVRFADCWRSDDPGPATVLFSQNGFDLFPGETRVMQVEVHRSPGAAWPPGLPVHVTGSTVSPRRLWLQLEAP